MSPKAAPPPQVAARYELARGMYDVRVAADGYETLRARVVLASGCTMDLPIAMRQRPAK